MQIKLDAITFDPALYPRNLNDGNEPFYLASWRYKRAMEAGEVFSPIVLADFKKKLLLIDGYNRLLATKKLEKPTIEAEIIKPKSYVECYIEAVRRNTAHGTPLGPQEIRKAANKLKELGVSMNVIASIVHIPVPEIRHDLETHIQKSTGGQTVVVKSMFHNLSKSVSQEDQKIFSGNSQAHLLKQTIALFKNDLIDLDNMEVVKLVDELAKLIRKAVSR